MIDYPRHSTLPQRSRELLAAGFMLGKSTPLAMASWLFCQWEGGERKMTDAEFQAADAWCKTLLDVLGEIGDRRFEVKVYEDFWIEGDGSGIEDTAHIDMWDFENLMTEMIDRPFWQAELFFAAYMGQMDQVYENLVDEVTKKVEARGWEIEPAEED